MTIPLTTPAHEIPRPKDVGILAVETYFPRRVRMFFFVLMTVLMSIDL